jgi:hypothetical protein
MLVRQRWLAETVAGRAAANPHLLFKSFRPCMLDPESPLYSIRNRSEPTVTDPGGPHAR